MRRINLPVITVKNWLDVSRLRKFPEAQDAALDKIYLYFDDEDHAEDWVEAKEALINIDRSHVNLQTLSLNSFI